MGNQLQIEHMPETIEEGKEVRAMSHRTRNRHSPNTNTPSLANRWFYILPDNVGKGILASYSRFLVMTMVIFTPIWFRASAADAVPTISTGSPAEIASSVIEWPRVMPFQGGELRVYHPHVESLKGNRMTFRAAFSMTTAAEGTPTFGVVWISGRAVIDRENRTIALSDQTVTKVHLPAASAEEEAKISSVVTETVKGLDPTLSLDRILTTLNEAERDQQVEAKLNATPPAIIVDEHRAMLLYIDGDTHMAPIAGSRFERIMNTPYPVVRDPRDASCWLLYGGRWYTAPVVTGPWTPAVQVKEEVSSLAPILEGVPGNGVAEPLSESVDIIVSQIPAELISIDGPPTYDPIQGTSLLAVTNSDNDLFEVTTNQQHYVLLNGRWFHTGDLAHGAWDQVPHGALPLDFANIPPNSLYADILAHVPGTPEATEAVLDAHVPQTAEVKRDATIQVTYAGDPQFRPIASTSLSYAVNSPMDVIKVADNDYYCCYQGVWYRASFPNGPWLVSTSRPTDINTIPPDNPLYNDRYVNIYDSTPEYVDVGYTPGYLGSYEDDGCVVWGTGFNYNGWWGGGYIARPCTWGFGMCYNPWSGHWGVGAHGDQGGRHGGFGFDHDHGGWWGPGGFHPVLPFREATDRQGTHIPSSEMRSDAQFSDQRHADNLYRTNANRDRVLPQSISRTFNHAAPEQRLSAPGQTHDPGRIMSSHEGDVYKHDGNAWQQWQHEGWKPLPSEERHEAPQAVRGRQAIAPAHDETAQHVQESPRPQAPSRSEQLNRQMHFENRGVQRAAQFQHYRSSTSGSFRSSGGGFRGGGGGLRGGGGGSRGGGGHR
jgi:hypothetical protein